LALVAMISMTATATYASSVFEEEEQLPDTTKFLLLRGSKIRAYRYICFIGLSRYSSPLSLIS
jgi:hypothetical protein